MIYPSTIVQKLLNVIENIEDQFIGHSRSQNSHLTRIPHKFVEEWNNFYNFFNHEYINTAGKTNRRFHHDYDHVPPNHRPYHHEYHNRHGSCMFSIIGLISKWIFISMFLIIVFKLIRKVSRRSNNPRIVKIREMFKTLIQKAKRHSRIANYKTKYAIREAKKGKERLKFRCIIVDKVQDNEKIVYKVSINKEYKDDVIVKWEEYVVDNAKTTVVVDIPLRLTSLTSSGNEEEYLRLLKIPLDYSLDPDCFRIYFENDTDEFYFDSIICIEITKPKMNSMILPIIQSESSVDVKKEKQKSDDNNLDMSSYDQINMNCEQKKEQIM